MDSIHFLARTLRGIGPLSHADTRGDKRDDDGTLFVALERAVTAMLIVRY
jgi:hypothetical protein